MLSNDGRRAIEAPRRGARSANFVHCGLCTTFSLIVVTIISINLIEERQPPPDSSPSTGSGFSLLSRADAHIILTRDEKGQSLVMTEPGKKKWGKAKGGDTLVIAGGGGEHGGGHHGSNVVLDNVEDREGDVVMYGKSMIVPGKDGHIVLADNRDHDHDHHQKKDHHGINGQQLTQFVMALWLNALLGNRPQSHHNSHSHNYDGD